MHSACIWCSTTLSWRCLIHDSPGLISPDPRLSHPEDAWYETLTPRCRFLVTECQGLAELTTSYHNSVGSSLPLPDHTILTSSFLMFVLFFLISLPIPAACWSNRDSIRSRLVFSNTSWTMSNTIHVLYLKACPRAINMSLAYPDHLSSLILLWILEWGWCPHLNTKLLWVLWGWNWACWFLSKLFTFILFNSRQLR